MARALVDPRMTPEVEQQMLFNANANIPESNCESILNFCPFMESSEMVEEETREELGEARKTYLQRISSPSELARSIWDDASNGKCDWLDSDECIQHPTFRGGSYEVYTDCASSMARALVDPRMTPEVEQQMLFNANANIPESNCESILNFCPFMESSEMVEEKTREELAKARKIYLESNLSPLELARSIWEDAGDGKCEWRDDDECIEHPTYRGGSREAYTSCASTMARVLVDPRINSEVAQHFLFNIDANIPMSNCGPMIHFYRLLKKSELVDEKVLNELNEAVISYLLSALKENRRLKQIHHLRSPNYH